MKIKNFIVITFVTLFLFNCATVISGTQQDIYISSKPEGATIYIAGLQSGVTPAVVPMKKPGLSSGQLVTLKHRDYKTVTFMLQKNIDVVAILNWANLPFWAIDVFTGAVMKYNPTVYNIMLENHEEAINIKDLPINEFGYVEVPNLNNSILVVDEENDLEILFK